MTDTNQTLVAVLAALTSVHEHVEDSDDDEFATEGYNCWVRMLDGTAALKAEPLLLPDTTLARADYLMHIEACIAFLNAYQASETG